MNGGEPSEALLAGRRALDALDRVAILDDWVWHERARSWVLHLQLSAEVATGSDVPTVTDWYVTAPPAYPWGDIRFYPAMVNGLTSTYHHQMHNGPGPDGVPWRNGWLCLRHPRADSRSTVRAHDEEPTDAHWRLHWQCVRALDWLRQASDGELAVEGDPFELPHFPSIDSTVLAFSENESSLGEWSSVKDRVGLCDVRGWPGNERTLMADRFTDVSGEAVVGCRWPRDGSDRGNAGAWIRLDDVPVVRNWEVATSWQDLLSIEPEFSAHLSQAAPKIRDGKEHVLLLGFPIPERVGESPSRMHWQGLPLPALTNRPTRGFPRNTERSYWLRDRTTVLHGRVDWMVSQNWAEDQLTTRGRLSEQLTASTVLLVGCGALGAPLAEMLVRSGVTSMVLVDGEDLAAGNLVRHTLTVNEVGLNKASALADRLNAANVNARIQAIAAPFRVEGEGASEHLGECDVIIDCTADDDVLRLMQTHPWGRERFFVSLSMGYSARRLFCFAANGSSFPRTMFVEQFRPHWERERADHPLGELPREGIGCWHPIFPARVDDVWLMASLGLKFIEGALLGAYPHEKIVAFEQGQTEAGTYRLREAGPGASDAHD